MIVGMFVFGLLCLCSSSFVLVMWERADRRNAKERSYLLNLAVSRHVGEAALLNRSLEAKPKPQREDDLRHKQPGKPHGL